MTATSTRTRTLLITRGVPASGKSTWSEGWVFADRAHRRRINRDDLRKALFGSYWGLSSAEEDQVTQVQLQQVRYLLQAGFDVVVDDTNLRPEVVAGWLQLAHQLGVEVAFRDFHVTRDEALRRDWLRGLGGHRAVGREVIDWFFDTYFLEDGLPPRPRRSLEG